MAALLEIDGCEFHPPLLTGEDIVKMTKSGILPEGRGFELIEGVLVRFSRQKSSHVAALSATMRFFNCTLPDEFAVAIAGSMFLSERTILEPDICIYPTGMPSADVRGQDILLAIEISDTTLRYDLGKKASLYAEHGVSDYWVVDLNKRLVHRHANPSADGYQKIEASGYDTAISIPFVEGMTFDPSAIL